VNRYKWDRALHGTDARAERHRRDGETPVRRYCPACADAQTQARNLRKGTKIAGAAAQARKAA
jgi:hypothetical protein